MKCSYQETEKADDFVQSCTCVLAMATVPMQSYGPCFEPKEALLKGTVFKDLDLPFYIGGGLDGR